MAKHNTADSVKETTPTTGTGTLTLSAAAPGCQRFQTALSAGDSCYYRCEGDGGEWEVGLGTLATTTTLSRDLVIASSNSNALVSFSTGTKYVALVSVAAQDSLVDMLAFGDGSDGDVSISSGTTTLTRDMYYHNLTLSGTGNISSAGYRIFVSGTLDLSGAAAASIQRSGLNGSAGSGGTGGGAAATRGGVTIGGGGVATAGANGGTAAGANATAASNVSPGNGGAGGAAGNGGTGSGGAGGTGGTAATVSNATIFRHFQVVAPMRAATIVNSAASGSGGGGGGGDGTAGGGGGGGGSGGGFVWIVARRIKLGGSTSGIISVKGGAGGAGQNAAAGNRGGGGGGSGGGGGWVLIAYQHLESSNANLIDASGGSGGNGGTKTGTGTDGAGGAGGDGGRVTLMNLATKTVTETFTGTGAAASGVTGGTGGSNMVGM